MLHRSITYKQSHMGKLSKRRHSARINITPSTLQVQRKIDESAAHCCLIVFTINLMPKPSITLYIIIHFCAPVKTHTQDLDWPRHCASVTWVWITPSSTRYYCIPPLSVCWQTGPPRSVLLVATHHPAAAENETIIKGSRFAVFFFSSSQLSPSRINRVSKKAVQRSVCAIKPDGDQLLLVSGLQMFIKLLQVPDWQMNRQLFNYWGNRD